MLTACSVKFYLRPDRAKRMGLPIWLRVIVNCRTINLYTYYDVSKEAKWDAKSGRVKGASRQDNFLNLKLANIEAKVFELRDSMERSGKQFTVADARVMLKNGTKANDITFIEYFKKHIGKIKLNPKEYGETVVKQYFTTMAHFASYLNSIGNNNLLLRELSTVHLVGFEEFLLTQYKNPKLNRLMRRSTSNKYLSRVRTVLNAAVRSGAINRSPFQLGFKLKGTKTARQALSLEQIDTIATHSLGNTPALDRCRDIFIWGCYTGMRWSDGQALRAEDIKFDKKTNRYWVLIRQKKTKEILELPLLSKAEAIYHKYKEYRETTGYILPRLSNQKVNSYLQVIKELTGISTTANLTSHIARYSFASTILQEVGEGEVSIDVISKLLGHTSTRATQTYARVSRQLLSKVAEKVDKQQIIVKPDICLN